MKSRIVRCPACRGDSVYGPDNPYRPFCSERCKSIDFGDWASERFTVPDPTPPDDIPFGDPKEH
ncbi:DNA gyrase inhibitor YacG [Ramlibacter sp.]|uniref:DNA gyrase inhibitor YacG n=1 Tax=Ramlibacter sp. TaxID=1917967 RepID=UPI003D1345E6